MKQTGTIDRTQRPNLGKKQTLQLLKPEVVVLDNGIKLYVIDGESTEVTRLDVVFDAGTAFQEKKLVAATTNSLLRDGTTSYSSFEISEMLDYYGAYLHQFAEKDTAGISLYALTKYYPKLLPLLREMITGATFSQEELRIHLDRELHEFRVKITKVRYKAMQEFNRMMFGNDTPYGRVAEEEDFTKVVREDVRSFYQQHYVASKAYFVLSGKVDEEMIENVNEILGQPWNEPEESGFVPENFTTQSTQKALLIEKKRALQSAIRVGRSALHKTHPDYSRFILFNTIIGGYFGSRLMSSLREEKGLTYGIHSFVKNYRYGNYFSIATEVNATQTVEAVEEIFNQIEWLRKEPVKKDELQLVKNYLYGSFLRGFDGPFALADRFRDTHDFQLTFDFYKKHLFRMMQISSEELMTFANNYFNKEDLNLLVVGNTDGF